MRNEEIRRGGATYFTGTSPFQRRPQTGFLRHNANPVERATSASAAKQLIEQNRANRLRAAQVVTNKTE